MAFKATLSDVSLLKDSVTSIAELVTEGTFKAKKDGLFFVATDPTMVTMVDFKFLASAFDEYKTDKDVDISVNLDNLVSVLKRAGAGENLILELDEKANKLLIMIQGKSARKFTIPLLDLGEHNVPDLNLDFPASMELKTEIIQSGVEDASIVADTVIFSADKDTFSMSADGDLSRTELSLPKSSDAVVGFESKEPVTSRYSLDYLKKIMKAARLSDTVKINIGKDFPVKITFRVVDKVQISYVLAPRVED